MGSRAVYSGSAVFENSIRITAIATMLVLGACQGEDAQTPPERRAPQAVKIVPHQVGYATDTVRVEAVGTARARASATIQAEVAGEVIAVNFTSGDKVSRGDVLIRLESRAEQLAVEQAEVSRADAQRLIDRYNTVSTPGVIAGNELDRAEAAYDAAEISLSIARDALGDRTIRAPFSGYVGLTDVDPGARITPDTVLTRLDDRDVLYVDFPVPEQTFGRITAGDVFEVEPFSNPEASYEAEVLTIDSAIDTQTRAYTVRTAIDNSEDQLRPGMSFRIGFELPGQQYPSVPEASIVWGGDGAFVWAVRNGETARVPVTIVNRMEGMVLIRGDIPEGSWIVEEGVQKVRQGTPVEMPASRDTRPVATNGLASGGQAAAQP
ncbi:efflux RND transporter periplasmic adaptor subunit [Henriciella barbarensis]|uniref:efflux RND transporter periplasmic adaptor subunit n=1 Tax=Henriciella barbarensis TaxID=86342 RepID=UPI001F3FC683|nr:efflux RND transporter periplasmic adaptor subunit [Henriciella barbarensis]